MIKVEITVNIDGMVFKFESGDQYSSKVAGGQASVDVDKAEKLLVSGYNKLIKALESQR